MASDREFFSKQLLHWNKYKNSRLMPWKGEKDPYKIWLSEIILQQTRVEQGWDYYNRFISVFPNVKKLAAAPEQKVFKLWEGLGYYTRCKNLISTAKCIAHERKGKFPDSYNEIIKLKGIGPYTAAAVASFAFNLPYAVIDGNVFRVLSRFFGIDTPIDNAEGKKIFTSLAADLLDKKLPGIYNQAIMDFGATICKPKNPKCGDCPLKSRCVAVLANKVNLLPVKTGKMIKKLRWFYYLIVEYNGKFYIRKRPPKDIWENLYEFVLIEAGTSIPSAKLKSPDFYKNIAGLNSASIRYISNIYKQQLTHQTIQGCFIHLKIKNALLLKDYKTVTYKELADFPFPKFIAGYLAKNELETFVR
jgi:A/G-specific adenine glycosylase